MLYADDCTVSTVICYATLCLYTSRMTLGRSKSRDHDVYRRCCKSGNKKISVSSLTHEYHRSTIRGSPPRFPDTHFTMGYCGSRTQTLNTADTKEPLWTRSWAIFVHFSTPEPIYLRSILMLFSHLLLGLPSGRFSRGFPTKILYAFLVFPS